ncbi:hypothetical protein [Halomonas elongata]|uniref:Uncharacterized protein n=1 Tax=Halomonas elongata (strain ATCC 33173 / DSM 2581 / NBRC 15536 / NCIMB 2198 / 1H9) TaxID=768066 RepID=E1VAW5_HALED|nr:hypothetical protein [Halomonas elongata]WBF17819.1 hypothetical protein LM502_17405 [Halomonas elongata]WPU46664.1 hypothetical protein SR933_15655 [Halomonas elongata DSM 2581]CBV44064.1 uncharacterized protein HELO_4180 [Halomonas elongata DSM 2581]
MNDPDIIDAMLQRVRDQCPGLATVEEAWFAEPIDNFDAQTPAAAIYLAEDGAASEPETIRPTQRITLSYGIWLVTKRADFRPQRQALRSALMGWEPTEEHEPVAYRGGQTTDIRGELIWWREFWNVDTWLRG